MLFTFYVAHVPGIVLPGLTKMKHGEGEGAESIAFYTRDIDITYQVWKYGIASVLLVYQRSSSKEGHTAIRPESELIRDFILLTPLRKQDVGNHVQGRPRIPLQTANLRMLTMEKELAESPQ